MELNELRALWNQQPPHADLPLSKEEVTQMRTRQSISIIERLRGNARLELGLNALVLLLLPAVIYFAPNLLSRAMGILLVPVCLVCLYYFYRKLRLLRSLTTAEHDVRLHLASMVAGMRALIRFYNRFTLAMYPVSLLCGLLIGLYEKEAGYQPAFSMAKLATVLAATLIVGGGFFWLTIRFTRWYLQCLYGRHLDRLEALLRELEQ